MSAHRVPRVLVLVLSLVLANAPAAHAQDSTKSAPPPKPCSEPEHRQFDFWIGNWNVTTPDGKPAGSSRIESIAGSCALLENWSGSAGGNGKSLNYYSPKDGKWHQTWVGSGGSFLLLEGGLEDGKMVLTGTNPTAEGGTRIERITWTPVPDGRVQQHWQQSNDGGKTWTDAFVGIYAKR